MEAERGRPKSKRPTRVAISVVLDADQAECLAQLPNRSEVVRQALALFLPDFMNTVHKADELNGLQEAA